MKTISRFAIIPASGIGDLLIMLIAARQLHLQGHCVTLLSPHWKSFGPWLSWGNGYACPSQDEEILSSFDAILVQHDNSPKAKQLVSLRKKGLVVYIFYPTYHPMKHGPLCPSFDVSFDSRHHMVDNVCRGMTQLFGVPFSSEHGLVPPPELIYRKNPRRVLIHPTSSSREKNWSKKKFLQVSLWLHNHGFSPTFLIPATERASFPEIEPPLFSSLAEIASFLYESGAVIGNSSFLVHLASALSIPNVVIGPDKDNMLLWRPGWHAGEVLFPPPWIPRLGNLRQHFWRNLITTKSAINAFNKVFS